MTTPDDDGVAEIRAVTAAFLAGDIGEALRLVAVQLDRLRGELAEPGLDAMRRAQLERSIRLCEFTRERLLI